MDPHRSILRHLLGGLSLVVVHGLLRLQGILLFLCGWKPAFPVLWPVQDGIATVVKKMLDIERERMCR